MTKKKVFRHFLVAVCALGLATIATTTAMMIAGLSASEASITLHDATVSANYGRYFVGGNNNGLSQTNAQALFGRDKINSDTATELMKVVEAVRPSGTANKTAADFSSFVNTKVAKQGAVYVRLFEPITGGTTEAQSFTKSTHANTGEEGKGRWWRIVHLQGDVLTLWMAEPYRDSIFGSNNTYSTSNVRNVLFGDFASVYFCYNKGGRSAIDATIVTTTPYSITAITGSGAGEVDYHTNPTVSDRVWLPTGFEVCNTGNNTTNYNTETNYTTTRAGYWQVNGIDRAYQRYGSVYNAAFLRSARPGMSTHGGSVICEGRVSNGTAFTNDDRAVRPAIHIDLAEVRKAIPTKIMVEIE